MISYDDIKSGKAVAPTAKPDANSIPSLIDRAAHRLAEAKTSAEVLEAKAAAELALHYAKVTKAANESHADCLRIITRAEIRMASAIDQGQETGDVAKPGRPNVQSSDSKVTMDELGVSRQRVNEWRKVADAGEEKVEEAISEALAEGRAPTKADVHRAAGIVKDKPKNPATGYDAIVEAWTAATPEDRDAFVAYLRVSGVIPSIPEAPKSRPVDPAAAASSRERPATAKTSDQEPSEAEGSGGVQDEEAIHPATIPETPAPPPAGDRAGEATPPASPATQSKADMIRRIRPHCQHLDDLSKCGGSGREHCGPCKRLMAEREAA